jgi:hypothetical protein
VKFESGRVTWLFPLEEFVPLAGSNNPSVIVQIAARYGFTRVPMITTQESMAKNGLPFGMGHFEVNGARFAVTDFVVYNDGIVAVAEKTDWAEAFLVDVTSWVREQFGFRNISSRVRRLYASTIVVDFETPLSRILSGYEIISKLITSRTVTIMPEMPEPTQPMQFSRIDFEVDRTTMIGQLAVPKFVLERRSGVSFSQERYFSIAPMHTTDHVAVIEQIEKLAESVPVAALR